jgi:HAD superfamily hydrolase (TIGR01490 family)
VAGIEQIARLSDDVAIAFFKVDRTLLEGSAVSHIIRHFWDEGFLGPGAFFKMLWFSILSGVGRLPETKLANWGLNQLKGLSVEQFRDYIDGAYEHYIYHRFYQQSAQLIASHREKGHLTVIISSVPEYISERIRLQLGADTVISAVAQIKDGIVSTIDCGAFAEIKDKLEVLKNYAAQYGADLRNCYFYSGYSGDLPLLAAIGYPVLVNPSHSIRKLAVSLGCSELCLNGYADFTKPALPPILPPR